MGDRVPVGAELLQRGGELGVACLVGGPHRGVVDLDDVEAELPERRVDLLVGGSQLLERLPVRPQLLGTALASRISVITRPSWP